MKVRYTNTALVEIADLLRYVAAHNREAAGSVADEIKRTVVHISAHPKLARVVYKGDVRAVPVGRYNYRIFYMLGTNGIIIRNVRSAKRKRPWEE